MSKNKIFIQLNFIWETKLNFMKQITLNFKKIKSS